MWPHFFAAGQLVLEVHAGGAGFDHRLHQFEGIQHAAEAGLGVGHDRLQEVGVVLALGVLDLVGAQQGVVDALHHRGTEFAGYSDWSGYISPAPFASAATCQPLR
jgi:hypothetical protein